MSKNPFLVLGVEPDCTQNELYEAYKDLRNKYSNLRFADGEVGADACVKLEEIELAYNQANDILRANSSYNNYYQQESTAGSDYSSDNLDDVESNIKSKNYDKAQEMLDNYANRDARWHYLQSVIFYQKNWLSDSLKQLEFACSLDAQNIKYQESRQALQDKINANSANNNSSFYQNNDKQANNAGPAGQQRSYTRNTGAGNAGTGICNCCSSLICADCCCECMGGDLISCC
ncbi:MAG: hypothetical protein WCR54_01750 [Clostridia bacterium]